MTRNTSFYCLNTFEWDIGVIVMKMSVVLAPSIFFFFIDPVELKKANGWYSQ